MLKVSAYFCPQTVGFYSCNLVCKDFEKMKSVQNKDV